VLVCLYSRLCVQAFTKVFESSKAHSAIKLSCLSAMAEMLLSVRSSLIFYLILELFSTYCNFDCNYSANTFPAKVYNKNDVF
jgi:ABC-type sulfate transport system permease component